MKLDVNKYNTLDKETILELLETFKTVKDLDTLLTKIDEVTTEQYNKGYDDGFDSGRLFGYDEDTMMH